MTALAVADAIDLVVGNGVIISPRGSTCETPSGTRGAPTLKTTLLGALVLTSSCVPAMG